MNRLGTCHFRVVLRDGGVYVTRDLHAIRGGQLLGRLGLSMRSLGLVSGALSVLHGSTVYPTLSDRLVRVAFGGGKGQRLYLVLLPRTTLSFPIGTYSLRRNVDARYSK